MPKSIPASLQTVLDRDVPTVAVFCDITRHDGTVHRFTSHDVDVTKGANTYLASNAFTLSAVANSADLEVDDAQVVMFFDDDEIPEDDVVKGLLADARVELFIGDRDDTTNDLVSFFTGVFGDVTEAVDCGFQIELRDLSQFLKNTVGERRQASCRVDLGHPTRCLFPIEPPLRQDSVAYAVGDYIRVPGLAADPLVYGPTLNNASFEADGVQSSSSNTNVTGWTVTAGNFRTPISLDSGPAVTAHSGSYFLTGGAADGTLQQDVDITALDDYNETNVDAGNVDVRFVIYTNEPTFTGRHEGRVILQARDGALALISTMVDSGFFQTTQHVWTRRVYTATLPANTRNIRVILRTGNGTGNEDFCFDTASLSLTDNAQTNGSSAEYADRIFECTVAGTTAASAPTYSTTVGDATVDGTATFVAREAFTIAAVVEASFNDGLRFTVDDALLDAARFNGGAALNYGALTWETGKNKGLVSQVKSCVEPEFELLFQAPFAIASGDAFRVAFGCDKLRATCRDRFVIPGSTHFSDGNVMNFQGEPDLPGRDVVFRTPDAR